MEYYPMTDNGGGVSSYARYYFPTDGTPITMDLEAVDESEEPHRVVVGTSEGSEFNLNADQAINLSGDYRSVILGQELFTVDNTNNNIGIDDDNWDGVDDTPETDPE